MWFSFTPSMAALSDRALERATLKEFQMSSVTLTKDALNAIVNVLSRYVPMTLEMSVLSLFEAQPGLAEKRNPM